MADTDHGGATAAPDDLDGPDPWTSFERRLAEYIATMTDETDHLVLDSPGGNKYESAPYAQFATFADGTMLHAEVAGNCYLAKEFTLDVEQCRQLEEIGWTFHTTEEAGFWDTSNGPEMDNWSLEGSQREAPMIARAVVRALRDVFGITHPHLLTHSGWGPARDHIADLGLLDAEEVPEEEPSLDQPIAVFPRTFDEFRTLVAETLLLHFGDFAKADGKAEFVLTHMDQEVRVHVHPDRAAVVIAARVAHEVKSRTLTAVRTSALNLENGLCKWNLRGDDIWLEAVVLAIPFAPTHLRATIDCFFDAMTEHRDDLVRQVGAQVG